MSLKDNHGVAPKCSFLCVPASGRLLCPLAKGRFFFVSHLSDAGVVLHTKQVI